MNRLAFVLVGLLLLAAGVSAAGSIIEQFGTIKYGTVYAEIAAWSGQPFRVDAGECITKITVWDASAFARTICTRIEGNSTTANATVPNGQPNGVLAQAGAEGCVAIGAGGGWFNVTLNTCYCPTAGTGYFVVYNGTVNGKYIGANESYFYRGGYTVLTGANTPPISWAIGVPVGTNVDGYLWDEGTCGGGGANDTQTIKLGVSADGGPINATHHNTQFQFAVHANSAIGLYNWELYTSNTTGGGYYLFHNETTPLNTTENTTGYIKASNAQFGICTYAIAIATNGTVTYSNATDCDYEVFWDDVNPTVSITTPAGGGAYERGNGAVLNAYAHDPWLLNFTLEYYYTNDTRISQKNQNTPSPHGTNVTLYYNETIYDDIPIDLTTPITYYMNLSAMDSHTTLALDKSFTLTKSLDDKTGASTLTAKEAAFKAENKNISTVTYTKLKDRFEYEYAFKEALTAFTETIRSDYPITIMDGSPYACHLTFGGSWWDAEKASEQGWACKPTRVSANEVRIDYTHDKGLDNLDPATGGMNLITSNQTYTVANHSASVPLVWLNNTTPDLQDVLQVSAQYSYANGTNITGATCTLIVEENNGTNSTYAMNASYQYNYDLNNSGNYVFFVSCGADYTDNAHNETTALIEGFTINAFNELTYAPIENWNVTITNTTNSMTRGPTNNTWAWANFTGGIPTGSVTIVISAGGYVSRTYYGVYNTGSYIALDAYLLTTTDGIYPVFIVRDASTWEALEGAVLTFRKNIGGTYYTVAQATSDVTGTTQVYLSASTNYNLTVVRSGPGDSSDGHLLKKSSDGCCSFAPSWGHA